MSNNGSSSSGGGGLAGHRGSPVDWAAAMTAPSATTWLNYSGDRTREIVGKVMGPNLLGEYLTVVSADYDETTNRTRLGLAYGIHQLEAAS